MNLKNFFFFTDWTFLEKDFKNLFLVKTRLLKTITALSKHFEIPL